MSTIRGEVQLTTADAALTGEFHSTVQFLFHRRVMIALFLVGLAAIRLWSLYLFLPEHRVWSYLFFAGFSAGFLIIALNLIRFLMAWTRLKRLLNQIVLAPMTGAFDQLPSKVKQLFGGYLFSQRPHFSHLAISMHQLGLLKQETDRLSKDPKLTAAQQAQLTTVSGQIQQIQTDYASIEQGYAKTSALGEAISKKVRDDLSALSTLLVTSLGPLWLERPMEEAFGRNPAEKERPAIPPPAGAAIAPAGPDPLAKWATLAEGFVATYTVLYAGQFFVQLRNQVTSLIVCAVLLLLGTTAYPFNIGNFILLAVLGLVSCIVAAVVYVLYEINVNELVSRVTGTSPNRFTPDAGFLSSLATYIVPAVVIVAVQLSGSFRYLLDPVLRAFK